MMSRLRLSTQFEPALLNPAMPPNNPVAIRVFGKRFVVKRESAATSGGPDCLEILVASVDVVAGAT